jgi:hypothetical protein
MITERDGQVLVAVHKHGFLTTDLVELRQDLAQLSPYQTRRLKRFGDCTLSLSPPEPFDPELLVPFPLEDQSETVVVA